MPILASELGIDIGDLSRELVSERLMMGKLREMSDGVITSVKRVIVSPMLELRNGRLKKA